MSTPAIQPFSAAHKSYVKSLYRRILNNELNWIVRRDIWRAKALAVRAEFDRNRCVPCLRVALCAWTCAETGRVVCGGVQGRAGPACARRAL